MYSDTPSVKLKWRITNTNPVNVSYTWNINGTASSGSGIATANSQINLFTNRVSGANTLNIFWNNQLGVQQTASKISTLTACVPIITFTSTNTTCSNSNGSIQLTISGGAMPYNYLWSNGITTKNLTNISAGNYTVTLTDANSTTVSQLVTITNSASPIASISSTNPTCGNSNGSVSVSISNGTSPYVILWSNGATTSSLNNLSAATYTVSITDAMSCTVVSSKTIASSGTPINKTVTSTSSTICEGSSTTLQVASSEIGVSYQLRNNDDDVNIGTPVIGTGNNILLSTGNLTQTSTFNVLATSISLGCNIELSNTPSVIASTIVNINTQPSNQTSCAGIGNTVNFNISNNGAVSYQWFEKKGAGSFIAIVDGTSTNGSTIYAGSNSSSLSISNPTFAMNGWTYNCVLSESCGSPTSNTVTLNINTPGLWTGLVSSDWNTSAN